MDEALKIKLTSISAQLLRGMANYWLNSRNNVNVDNNKHCKVNDEGRIANLEEDPSHLIADIDITNKPGEFFEVYATENKKVLFRVKVEYSWQAKGAYTMSALHIVEYDIDFLNKEKISEIFGQDFSNNPTGNLSIFLSLFGPENEKN